MKSKKRAKSKDWQHLYQTPRWRRLRKAQLDKQRLCERCMRGNPPQVVVATVVHHKEPHKGDTTKFFDPDNLASSCKPCHDSVEQSIERSGYEKGSDASGLPVDPKHHWNA